MEKKVTVKVFFRPAKNSRNTTCRPFKIIGNLLRSGDLKLVVQGMIAEMDSDREENNRNMCVAFMVSLIKANLVKGWSWVKGKSGQTVHNWLECDGFAVDASMMPGMGLKGEENSILVMDADEYKNALGLKVIQRRNDKQIKKWLSKHKPVQKEVIQDLRENNTYAPLNIVPMQVPSKPAIESATEKIKTVTPKVEPAVKKSELVVEKPVEKESNPVADDAALFDLSIKDTEDKKVYSDKLAAQILKFKTSGLSNTKIATMLMEKGLPTRSGRGSWNPRMVNDVYKSVVNA